MFTSAILVNELTKLITILHYPTFLGRSTFRIVLTIYSTGIMPSLVFVVIDVKSKMFLRKMMKPCL